MAHNGCQTAHSNHPLVLLRSWPNCSNSISGIIRASAPWKAGLNLSHYDQYFDQAHMPRSQPSAISMSRKMTPSRQCSQCWLLWDSHNRTWSANLLFGEVHSLINGATAPASMTDRVCSDVPETILVRAQAASNWTFSSFVCGVKFNGCFDNEIKYNAYWKW